MIGHESIRRKVISVELAEFLSENGCDIEANYVYVRNIRGYTVLDESTRHVESIHEVFPAYDLLNDICCRYAKEFFGVQYRKYNHQWDCRSKNHYMSSSKCTQEEYEGGYEEGREKDNLSFIGKLKCSYVSYGRRFKNGSPSKVLELLQQGKKQEAENYIKMNCIFNPKNR